MCMVVASCVSPSGDAYLIITTLEILINKIRNDTNIKGIKINKKEIKISLLADDITLIVIDLDSVKKK